MRFRLPPRLVILDDLELQFSENFAGFRRYALHCALLVLRSNVCRVVFRVSIRKTSKTIVIRIILFNNKVTLFNEIHCIVPALSVDDVFSSGCGTDAGDVQLSSSRTVYRECSPASTRIREYSDHYRH